jgi:acetyl esterase/lipase
MQKNRFIIIFALLLVAQLLTYGANRADSIRAKMLDPKNKEVLVAVHRGDWRNYAENSLEGIEHAIKMGADIVEVDLRRTKDGQLILMHDASINRTTTGKGKISELTLDSIRKVYLRSGVGEMTPYRVPTLEEVLLRIKGKALINLDKAFDYFDQVYELIEKTGTTSQIIMKGGADASVVKEKYGKYLDKVIYMPVVNIDKKGAIDKIKDYMKILKSPAYELVYRDTFNTVTYQAREILYGKARIWYNTLWSTLAGGRDDFASLKKPENGYGFLIDSLGASMLQTDQPAYLLGYLFDRKLKEFNCDSITFQRCKRVILDAENRNSAISQNKKIEVDLWPDGATESNGIRGEETYIRPEVLGNISTATMTVYKSPKPNSKAIIDCPGGSYIGEAVTHEGHDMANWFNSIGITYIVLKYRLPNGGHYNVPLADAQQAIRIARERCKEWNIDPNQVGIMGFSAGGHLAATAANLFTSDSRPDFQILLYPVITMLNGTHSGSCNNLLGKSAPDSLKRHFSMELQVTERTPKAFIVLASNDNSVLPIPNGISYYESLLKHSVPASIHIYPIGGHGFGFHDDYTYKREWTEELEKWLRTF